MAFRRMVDMAKTPAEVKEDSAPVSAMDAPDSGPSYPWGLCISLNEDDLKKLDITADEIDVGDMVHLFAMAKVTSKSISDNESSGPCCRIELQITHLAGEDEDTEEGPDEDDAPPPSRSRRYA